MRGRRLRWLLVLAVVLATGSIMLSLGADRIVADRPPKSKAMTDQYIDEDKMGPVDRFLWRVKDQWQQWFPEK
jgi:hypothetical protein